MRAKPGVLAAILVAALTSFTANAQAPKELKAKSGASVVMVNLLNARPDCSASPGPVSVPTIREKPANGVVQMLVIPTNVAAAGSCSARKVPSIALIYTANKNFVGTDSVQIEVEVGNRTTSLSYRINVESTAEHRGKDQL
jgi:hypothetical protein